MGQSKNRVGKRFTKMSPLQVEEAIALYRCGISLNKLAEKYLVSHVNLIKLFKIREVERRPRGRQAQEPNEVVSYSSPKHSKGTFVVVWIEHPNGVRSSYRFTKSEAEKRVEELLAHGVTIIPDPYGKSNYSGGTTLYDLV